jgi:peptide/nickel transport system substrate-binding protein
MKRHLLGFLAKVPIALLIALISTSLVSNPALVPPANAQQETTLRLGITTYPDTFNPLTFIMSESGYVLSMIYDMGIQMQGPKNDPAPDLAESWEVSPDGLTWTFHFVHNAKWHDGVPFTSEDFKFTLDYCTDYPNFNETLQQSYVISYMSTVTSTETPDPYTAIVHMSEPLADFGQSWFWILPKHIWENVPKEEAGTSYENNPPIGTGPFKYVDSKINEYIKLDANKEYFLGAPKVDHVIYKYYADPDTMVQALVAGEVDAIIPPSGSVDKLKTEKNVKVEIWPSRSISELGFNTWTDPESKGNPALLDYRFRQALAHAVDKDEIIQLAYHGIAERAESVLTPSMTTYYWEPSPEERLDFDIAKANTMLDDLGYTKWDAGHTYRIDPTTKKAFTLSCYVTNDATELISAGNLMVNSFKEIGIELKLHVVDSAQMIDSNLAGDMDLYLWGWGFDCDPDFALSVFTTDQIGSWSDCFYSNEEYDAMYAAQHVASNPQQRPAIIVDMQKHLYEQAPYVVLAYSSNIVAHRTDTFTGWGDVSKYPGWDVYWWKYATDLVPVTAATTTAMTETEMATQTSATAMPPAPGPGIEVYAGVIAIIVIVLAALAVLLRRRKKQTPEKEEP